MLSNWKRFGDSLLLYNAEGRITEMNATLYGILDDEIKSAQTFPRTVWALWEIWNATMGAKFFLKLIFDDFYKIQIPKN